METTKEYKTKQRDLILEFFITHKSEHLTAEQVIEHLKDKGTAVGKSTVYRHLEKLVSEGSVRKYFIEEGKGACYQYIEDKEQCHNHFHLKCVECGRLIHIECGYLDETDEHILCHHNFKVDNTKTVLYGICDKCF